MNIGDILYEERKNSGTSPTLNSDFEKNGYLVIRNLCDPKDLFCPVPTERGTFKYSNNKIQHDITESQVPGSVSRYSYPKYKEIHFLIKKRLEKEIGKSLYKTYYFDRFYFPGQELKKHIDRDSCEISVTVHVSTNLNCKWPIWIKTPDTYRPGKEKIIDVYGENISINLNPGDGLVYKGCERPHWRDPMPTEYKKTWYGKKIEKDNLYYHQIFFHYVLSNGIRSHFANDLT